MPEKPVRRQQSSKTNIESTNLNNNNNIGIRKLSVVATETAPSQDNVCVVCRTDKGYLYT